MSNATGRSNFISGPHLCVPGAKGHRALFSARVAASLWPLACLYHPLHVHIAPAKYMAASKYCIMEMRLLELHNFVLRRPNAARRSYATAANSPTTSSKIDYSSTLTFPVLLVARGIHSSPGCSRSSIQAIAGHFHVSVSSSAVNSTRIDEIREARPIISVDSSSTK